MVAVLKDYNQPPAGRWAFEDGCRLAAPRMLGLGKESECGGSSLGVGDMPAPTGWGSGLVWVTCQAPTRHESSGRATASQLSPGPLGLSLAETLGAL